MCVLAFAWHAHPHWPIVLAGNRDELHSRPASPLARWESQKHVIAGRDLQSGGTWLGVSDLGRLAVVTNLRGFGVAQQSRISRGGLVTGALSTGQDVSQFDDADFSNYNPFNLIAADCEQAFFLSNRPQATRRVLSPAIYGLSNGALDDPWPKTVRLKEQLGSWILEDKEDPTLLFGVLREESPANGSPEPDLSSIFIRNAIYGTRCSTVVAVDASGKGIIIERRFDRDGDSTGDTAISFAWPS